MSLFQINIASLLQTNTVLVSMKHAKDTKEQSTFSESRVLMGAIHASRFWRALACEFLRLSSPVVVVFVFEGSVQ